MYWLNKIFTSKGVINQINVIHNNIEVSLFDLGATIYSLKTRDSNNNLDNVVLELEEKEDYFKNDLYLNATIGPHAGRIKNAEYSLNNKLYTLEKNHLSNNLHSGNDCFAKIIFDYEVIEEENITKVVFLKAIPDNSRFPGNQKVKITYSVYETTLEIEHKVTTDHDTVINLTNHAYFNLSGTTKDNVLSHTLQINSSNIVETDESFVSKNIVNISKNMSFREEKALIGPVMLLRETNFRGIDHSYILDKIDYNLKQSTLFCDKTQRVMNVYTTYPIIHLYTDNFEHKETLISQNGRLNMGICFETQFMSNSINLNESSTTLKKDEIYHHFTKFEFSVRRRIK